MARTDSLGNFLTDVADAIRTKKGSSDTILASDFDTEIENLPSGGGVVEATEKDVNFYDHTGFRWYSYTKNEFLALESMPANPEIEGLTAQGWNWSFADAQDYVEEYGGLEIGQTYETNDNTIRIYIKLTDERKEPYVGFAVNGTATIDWGDNSTPDVVTGTSTSTLIDTQHIYAKGGEYVIKISSESKIYINGTSSYSNIYRSPQTSMKNIYISGLKKIELSNNVQIGKWAFMNINKMTSISIPIETTYDDNGGWFNNCTSLNCLIFPSGVTDISSCAISAFIPKVIVPNSITTFLRNDIYNGVEKFYMPSNIKRILQNAFNGDSKITHIIVTKKVNEINNYGFASCVAMKWIDFSHLTAIPTLTNTNGFYNLPADCYIIVPDDLYEDWKTASNWSTYASQIIKKSDYDAL